MTTLDIFEQIAENGHAPKTGCRLFGVGYDDALERLRTTYLLDRFGRGRSAEKFIVGPYGSGKTHFLRHLAEMAREINCVTAEVAFNKDLDPSKSLMVYQEVAAQVQPPGGEQVGIRPLLEAALVKVAETAAQQRVPAEQMQFAWAAGFDQGLTSAAYGKTLRRALEALIRGEDTIIDVSCRWLSGEVSDRTVAAACGNSRVQREDEHLIGRRSLLSLVQFVRRSGFRGTVIGFDEADQGLQVDRKKLQRILSMFQAGINALQDLENGSALIIYAVTPQIIEDMEKFPALQQRVVDPSAGQGFFDGNTFAPKINLTHRPDPEHELAMIAQRLVKLFFADVPAAPPEKREEADGRAAEIATRVAELEPSSRARREVARQVCTMLLLFVVPSAPSAVFAESEV